MYDDKIKYAEPPRQAFSHAVKMPEEKPRYDFYENASSSTTPSRPTSTGSLDSVRPKSEPSPGCNRTTWSRIPALSTTPRTSRSWCAPLSTLSAIAEVVVLRMILQ